MKSNTVNSIQWQYPRVVVLGILFYFIFFSFHLSGQGQTYISAGVFQVIEGQDMGKFLTRGFTGTDWDKISRDMYYMAELEQKKVRYVNSGSIINGAVAVAIYQDNNGQYKYKIDTRSTVEEATWFAANAATDRSLAYPMLIEFYRDSNINVDNQKMQPTLAYYLTVNGGTRGTLQVDNSFYGFIRYPKAGTIQWRPMNERIGFVPINIGFYQNRSRNNEWAYVEYIAENTYGVFYYIATPYYNYWSRQYEYTYTKQGPYFIISSKTDLQNNYTTGLEYTVNGWTPTYFQISQDFNIIISKNQTLYLVKANDPGIQ
ncbi:MAG: hypothetical protein MUF15_03845 [Acidobacteria bacterium]|jgi:hypothetical protein|nr:hypothetical protein [Acidobacteriota bacterium]